MRSFGLFFNILATILMLAMVAPASAALFWKTGKITRVMSETNLFGGCMIHLSTTIGNGCPDNGWVSLDCDGLYSNAEKGKRAYATALVARSLGSTVSVQVDNAKKQSGHCVGKRLDF